MLGVFVSTIVSCHNQLTSYWLTRTNYKNHKEMKAFQKEMMAAQKSGDPKAMAKVQKNQAEFMAAQSMMNSFKPMIVTFLPIILLFWWMASQPAINKMFVELPAFVFYVLLVPVFHMVYHQSPGVPYMAIEWLRMVHPVFIAMSFVWRKLLGLKGGECRKILSYSYF